MELKTAHRRTEVSVVPKGWEVKRIREFASCSAGGTPSTLVPEYWGGSIRWMTSGELHLKQVRDVANRITENGLLHSSARMLPTGCVLVGLAGQGKTRGTVAMNLVPLCTNQSIAAILPNPTFVSEFLFHNLENRYDELRDLSSGGGGRGGLNLTIIGSMEIPLPSVSEQRAIARALSDMDSLLDALDQLIAKKLDLKQAAFQQLLTGQTRMPGFRGKWERKHLGEIGYFLKGSGVKRDDALSGTLACVRYGEIYTTHHDYIRTFHSRISSDVAATATRLKCGDLLFTGSGETKEEIGKCVAFVTETLAYAGGDILILRAKNVSSLYFGYMLNMPAAARQKASLSQGDAVVHISATALAQVTVDVPSVEEQNAIATVLTDIDSDIAALEARRDKTRDLKQAMMQELLTGNTRLVKPEATNA